MQTMNQPPQSALNSLAVHYIVPCQTAQILSRQGVKLLQHEAIPWVTCGECLNNNSGGPRGQAGGGRQPSVDPSVMAVIRWKQDKGQSRMRPGGRRFQQ